MSTRLGPWGSGAVEIATRKVIPSGSVGLAQVRPLTRAPAMRRQPSAELGAATVHPIRALIFDTLFKCITFSVFVS